jgi:predicted ATPase
MLQRLKFENFKSWPSAELDLAPITGFFGTNSSGKTSIIQFLLLLKQTKEATDRTAAFMLNGEHVKLGTPNDMIHGHVKSARISFELGLRLDQHLALANPENPNSTIADSNDLRLEFIADLQGQQIRGKSLEYKLGNASFRIQSEDNRPSRHKLTSNATDFTFVRTQGRAWDLPGPIKCYAFPDQARTYFQNANFLADLELSFEKTMDQLYYLGPLRDYPQRDYLWSRARPTDVGNKGERAIEAILAATEAGETRNLRARGRHKPFQEMVAHWLREMGLIEEFRVAEIAPGSNRWQAWVKTRKGATEVLLTDVGFGISQVLPVITLLLYVPTGSTVILEQPEIHLHPLAQAHLADVIIYAATHRKVQVIVESHSEHLLLRLQRRLADETLSQNQVRLYFCDAPNGVSQLQTLELDLYGNIQNWPVDFMGDAFGETAEAEKARLRRMLRQSHT